MSRPVLIFLAGLPAAGKTRFASSLGHLLHAQHGIRSTIIASDTVRAEIPALEIAFIPDLEPLVRRMTLDRVESALMQGLWVIHDDLNYYRSMRFEIISIARAHEVPHAFIHVATPRETCLDFNVARGRKIPDEVIRKDDDRFDTPGLDPWDAPFAVVKAPGPDAKELDEIVNRLLIRSKTYRPEALSVKEPHIPSRAEAIDLLARKIVGELYRSGRGKVDGKTVSQRRQELVTRAGKEALSNEEAEALFRTELGALFHEGKNPP
jgi:tRNA uridine 5-carbamoylmethylation protein Kti12